MKKVQDILLGLAGLVMLAALGLGLAAAFRALSAGGVPGAAEDTPRGYPPPHGTSAIAMPDAPATRVPGYPPPATEDATQWAAIVATQYAEATAHTAARLLTPSHGPLLVDEPQTVYGTSGVFSLEIMPGWEGAVMGNTVHLRNFDPDQVGDYHTYPPNGLKIFVGIGAFPFLSGESFEEWQAAWIASETASTDEGPGQTVTRPMPYTVGRYMGSAFTLSGPPPTLQINLLVTDPASNKQALAVIQLTPADSPAVKDALEMLSTLTIFPERFP